MAAKPPPVLFAWVSYLFLVFGWIIMLGGLGGLQNKCDGLTVEERAVASTVGYLGPVRCSRIYGYAWWTLWYQFLLLFLIPGVLIAGTVHRFRLGLIGLIIPNTYLLIITTDTMFGLFSSNISKPPSRALLAGTVLSALFEFVLVILFGAVDEEAAALTA